MSISMTTGEDNRFSIVEVSFGPRIVIFESQDVVEACRRNGLEGFSSLVRPFEYIDRVSVRHSNYSTTVKDSLRLSFFSAGKLSEEGKKILDSDGQRERHDQDGWIKDSLIQNVFNRKSIDRWNSNMRAISSEHLTSNPTSPSANQQTSFKLKRENEWIGSELLSSDYTEEYPRPSTPWYNGFLSSLIEHRPLVQFDSTSHPIAALVVVSTNHPEPLNEFAKLYEASGKDGSGWPSLDWFESGKILRYYLLVHEINEEPDGGRPAAIDLLESLKRAYGLNCGLFCMNSENTDWLKAKRSLERDRDPGNVRSDDQPKKFDHWFKFNQNNQQHQLVDLNDEDVIGKRFGEFISEEDVLSLRLLLREFTLQSLIPHIERCVQQWNETLAASRKGITGRLFSVGRKYFSKASAAGSGSSTSLIPQSPTAYNPITQSYPHQSQEAQTRRLADYSFMLGDYKFASQMYDYVRKDARDDKAWSYCSSAIQMIGICTLLQSSSNQRSKLNVDLQSYLFDHLSIASSVGHLRMVMIYYEMSKAIGNPQLMSSSLIRASKTQNDLIAGIIYEQVSHSVSSRQATLYAILAAHRYELSKQDWLSAICFKQCTQLRGWRWMEDYLDKRIGKIAESESDWMLASQRYWNILKGRIESSCTGTVFERTIGEGDYGLDDELHLSLLKGAIQKGKIESSTLTSSLDHSCIQLVDVERCKIRIPEQQNYFDSLLVERVEVWDQLKDRYVGKGLGRSPDGNIAVVDEYIFLDMVFKNPLSAEICVKGVKIYLKSLTEEEQDLCEGKVEVEGAEDLNLSPLECRKVSLKLLSKVPDIKFEIVRVSYNFDSIFDCSQDMRKKGKRLQKTLVERRGMFYSRDKSMEVAVTGARPMVELSLVEDLVSEVYAGESVMGEIEVKNIGKVRLERLSCAFSHDSFFWICDDQGPEKGRSIYETDDEGQEGEIVLELPNHLVNEPPKLIVDKLEPGSSMRFVLGCRGESVGRHETCWLFSFQSAIENKGFNEDLELLMVGTFGSHWKSKLRSDKKSDWVLVNREGESRVRRIEFDIFPWSDSEEDRMTALMLKQLKKFLIKEELKDSDVCCSKVKVCACTTGLAGGRTIKLNSTRLLETIASSHRNLRKKEISSTFKTLRDSDISLIFPLSSTRSLDLVLLWRTTDSQRIGHHYLSDLKFGSTVDVVGGILESFEGKAGGMYEESQREQKALLGQWKRSEYGRMEDPIRVELEVENDFFDWNFKRDGPFILKVKFIIKNLSTTNEASYDLDLLETRGENNLDSKKEGRKSQRRSDIIVKKKEKVEKGYEDERVEVMTEEEDEEKDEDEEEEDEEGCDWIGKLSFRGTLKRLETIELESKALWVGTGIRDLGSWKIRTGYTDQGKLKELRFDKNDDYDRFGKVYYRWKTVGERKFISVNEIN